MVSILQLETELKKIERHIRRHGMWRRPTARPPQIRIIMNWDPVTQAVARILNRIFYIRSLPLCARMFGPARDTQAFAFLHDYKTPRERLEFARFQFNQLISDLRVLPIFSNSQIERIAA